MFLNIRQGEVVFLSHDGSKELVSHQYNGVACSQFSDRLSVKFLGNSRSYIFNPEWWYKHSGLFFDERTGGRFLYGKKIEWPSDPELWGKVVFHERYRLYYPSVIAKLQREINKLPHGFNKILINIADPNQLTEALVPAIAYPTEEDVKMWRAVYGWIAWNNSD